MNHEEIFKRLEGVYKNEGSQLDFRSDFELLIATILSAQCTDTRVNIVTAELFKERNKPEDFAYMDAAELEEKIRTCGFYKNKAKSIIEASRAIVENFGSKVPRTLEELTSLRGVGRKTANVVLSNAFGEDAFAVDTHVFRVTRRLGLTRANTPEGVERDMCEILPVGKWGQAHHWFIWHGRRVCHARKPDCENCVLNDICPYLREKGKTDVC